MVAYLRMSWTFPEQLESSRPHHLADKNEGISEPYIGGVWDIPNTPSDPQNLPVGQS